jgi:hypothetical protein
VARTAFVDADRKLPLAQVGLQTGLHEKWEYHCRPRIAMDKVRQTGLRAHPDTTTKAGSHANRNAGFIRQAGEWH